MCSIKQSMILPQQNAWIFPFQVSLFLLGPVLDVTGQKTNRCFKNSTVLSELWRQSSWGHDVLHYFLLNTVINQAWLDNKTFTVILNHFNRSFLQNHFNRHYIPTQQPGLRPTRWALHGKGASTTGEARSAPDRAADDSSIRRSNCSVQTGNTSAVSAYPFSPHYCFPTKYILLNERKPAFNLFCCFQGQCLAVTPAKKANV